MDNTGNRDLAATIQRLEEHLERHEGRKQAPVSLAAIRILLDAVREVASGEHVRIEHDDFAGTVQGRYVTREGKRGVVLQQDGTRVVHVYGERWLKPA